MKTHEIVALVLLALGAALVYGARAIAKLWKGNDEDETAMLKVKLVGAAVVLFGLTVLFTL